MLASGRFICASQQGSNTINLQGHLSNEQLKKVAELIRQTEVEPLGDEINKLRLSLMLWIINSPDISVTIFNILNI